MCRDNVCMARRRRDGLDLSSVTTVSFKDLYVPSFIYIELNRLSSRDEATPTSTPPPSDCPLHRGTLKLESDGCATAKRMTIEESVSKRGRHS